MDPHFLFICKRIQISILVPSNFNSAKSQIKFVLTAGGKCPFGSSKRLPVHICFWTTSPISMFSNTRFHILFTYYRRVLWWVCVLRCFKWLFKDRFLNSTSDFWIIMAVRLFEINLNSKSSLAQKVKDQLYFLEELQIQRVTMLRFTFYVLSCRHPQICVLHATSLYFRNFITWRKNGVVSGNFVICSCQPSHLPRHISFRGDLSSISKLYFSIKAHPQ